MSIRTKLEFNNKIINDTNQNLMVIKNAFIRLASDFGKIDTSNANATQEDILSGKIAYVNGTKLIGTHVCSLDTASTQEKTATPTTSSQEITPDSGKYLSKVIVEAIPSDYLIPSGNKEITENGSNIDVSSF